MFRELLHRGISVAAALTVLVSSIAIGTSAQGTQGATEVYPLLPMSVAAAGGLNAGFKSSDRLFAKAEVAVVSADTQCGKHCSLCLKAYNERLFAKNDRRFTYFGIC